MSQAKLCWRLLRKWSHARRSVIYFLHMKIKALLDVVVPGQPAFVTGEMYDVTEAVGMALVERFQAQQIVETPIKAKKPKSEPTDK